MIDIATITTHPGCYLFKDYKDKILYIGKAKNLRNRIKSYFQNPSKLDIKTQNLVKHIDTVEIISTDTEYEALILEDTLVKQHQPKYNIRLKDAKSFAFIQITNEEYPRVQIARDQRRNGRYFGPFVSAQERDYILHFIRKTFLIRTCKRLPKKACLRYHITLCEAPCIGNITKQEYQKKIKQIQMILSGKTSQLLKKLQQEMTQASKSQEFERALRLRNQISAIDTLNQRQNIQRQKTYNEDILNYEIKDGAVYLMVFNIHKGTLVNKNEFIFEYQVEFLEEFLCRYYEEFSIPREIIIPEKISDATVKYLSMKKNQAVHQNVPQRGEKKQLLTLVKKNIEITFFSDIQKITLLQKRLPLQEIPIIIECFDISHLSGTHMVGSMVQYRNGKPDKTNYRRFKIQTVEGIDDTAAIAEIVRRRYIRLQKEHEEFPNLIIIDGGKGQLHAALDQLSNLDIHIPILSIAKKFEEIYLPGIGEPIRLDKKDKALHFIQEMRDEAHRFAITYNKLLRKKEVIV